MIPDSKPARGRAYLICLLILVCTDTVYAKMYAGWTWVVLVALLAIMALLELSDSDFRRLRLPRSYGVSITLVFLVIGSVVVNRDYNGMNGQFVVLLLVGALVSVNMPAHELFSAYYGIIVVLAGVSLLGFAASFVTNPPAYSVSHNGTVYENYWGVYFQIQSLARNSAIFWEPGVYQYYLIVAMLFGLFGTDSKPHLLSNLIIVAALISTLSTSGFASMMLLSVAYALDNSRGSRVRNLVTGLGLTAVVLSLGLSDIIYSSDIASATVIGKISARSPNFILRVISLYASSLTGIKRPMFGFGMGSAYAAVIKTSAELNLPLVHLTSTMPAYLVSYGLPFALIILCGWVVFPRLFVRRLVCLSLVFAAVLVIQSSENLSSSALMVVLYSISVENWFVLSASRRIRARRLPD